MLLWNVRDGSNTDTLINPLWATLCHDRVTAHVYAANYVPFPVFHDIFLFSFHISHFFAEQVYKS